MSPGPVAPGPGAGGGGGGGGGVPDSPLVLGFGEIDPPAPVSLVALPESEPSTVILEVGSTEESVVKLHSLVITFPK